MARLIYLLFALFFISTFAFTACSSSNGENNLEVGSKVAVEGAIVCLPKKEGLPITLECKFGLKVDLTYYGLKNIPAKAVKKGFVRSGNRVKVYGKLVQAKLDTFYRIATAIDVNKIELLEKKPAKQNRFEGNGFSIAIPKSWIKKKAAPWSMITSQTDGQLLAAFQTAETFLKNTNFGYAKITVGFSDDQTAIEQCLQPLEINERVTQAKVKISGIVFSKISLTDAGAGNRYATDSYRILHDGKCWAVESVLNYSPIEFYGKDSGVTEFDREKAQQMIEEIIQTFKFK